MSSKGWVKLDRAIMDSWIYADKPFCMTAAWVDLLLCVNHAEGQILFDGKLETVQSGEMITSVRKLSERWGWGRDKTARFLDTLENDGKITRESNRRRTKIKLLTHNSSENDRTQNRTLSPQKPDTEPDTKPDTDKSPETLVFTDFFGVDPIENRTVTNHRIGQLPTTESDTEPSQTRNKRNKNERNNKLLLPVAEAAEADLAEIAEAYNTICKSFPPIRKLSEARIVLLRARMQEGYTLDHFKEVFQKAEESDYFKEGHESGWKVTFDWLIEEKNMIKVLEGTYDNRKGVTGCANGEKDRINPDSRSRSKSSFKAGKMRTL